VLLGVVLGRLMSVMRGVDAVTMRQVSMMAGPFVIAGIIMARRFPMVMGGILVVLSGRRVMLVALMRLGAHRFLHGNASAGHLARIP